MRLTGLSIGTLLLSFVSATAFAAWTANGPDGGNVFAVATAGGVLRIGTTDGVYESADGGANWTRLGDYPRGYWTTDVSTHPTNASIILASGSDQMYRSVDGGAHWLGTGQSLAHTAFQPLSPDDVLATDPNHVALHQSSDAGATWDTVNLPGNVPFPVGDVIGDPIQTHAFYALSYQQPMLYRSVTGGQTWTGLSDAAEGGYQGSGLLRVDPFNSNNILWLKADLDIVRAERFVWNTSTRTEVWSAGSAAGFVVDPHTSGRMWIVGVSDNDLKRHLYESLDHGATWPDAGVVPARLLGADPVTTGLLYGTDDSTFVRSLDSGRTWQARTHGLPLAQTSAVSIRPDLTSEILAAGKGYAVAISTDGGSSWSASTAGLTSTTVNSLVRSPQNPADVYAGGDDGLFHSIDGGRNWQEVAIASYPFGGPRRFVQLDIDRDNPDLLVANDVMWSDDAGVNWYEATSSNGTPDYRIIAHTSAGTGRVYALAWQPGTGLVLYRADAHGAEFAPSTGGLAVNAVAVHPNDDGTLFALGRNWGVYQNWVAYRSRDAGDHWETRGVLTLPLQGQDPQVRFDPCDPQTVYALAGSSFYVSPDQGLTWNEDPIAIPSAKMNDLDARCSDGSVAIAAATEYAGAQVRAPVAVNRIFVQGFEAD